jgi:hypothetical protein
MTDISMTKCSKIMIYLSLQFFLGEALVLQSAGDARESWREVFIHFCDSLEWFFTRYLELRLGGTKQDLWGLGAEVRIVYCSKLSFRQNDYLCHIGGSLWQKDSLLQYTMTLLTGPKNPVLPTLAKIGTY